jgi:cell division protein WhiA
MSFSTETKNELARVINNGRCCQLSELAALVKMDGILQISGANRMALNITTENAATARKIIILFKNLFDLHTEIIVNKKSRLKKNNIYQVLIPPQGKVHTIVKELGIIGEGTFNYGINETLLKRECCRRSYLRGAFLGGGSVNSPEGNYHLEIITNNEDHSSGICELINKYGLNAKNSSRKNWFVVYLKESEQIVELLNIMGAHKALLNFENVRIMKDMRNKVNRLVNCETANLNKTVNAAFRQIENIKILADTIGLDKLPASLREIAEVRLEYPDESLKELGEMLEPKVGKSGVNHRIRKLEKLAEKVREHGHI